MPESGDSIERTGSWWLRSPNNNNDNNANRVDSDGSNNNNNVNNVFGVRPAFLPIWRDTACRCIRSVPGEKESDSLLRLRVNTCRR